MSMRAADDFEAIYKRLVEIKDDSQLVPCDGVDASRLNEYCRNDMHNYCRGRCVDCGEESTE